MQRLFLADVEVNRTQHKALENLGEDVVNFEPDYVEDMFNDTYEEGITFPAGYKDAVVEILKLDVNKFGTFELADEEVEDMLLMRQYKTNFMTYHGDERYTKILPVIEKLSADLKKDVIVQTTHNGVDIDDSFEGRLEIYLCAYPYGYRDDRKAYEEVFGIKLGCQQQNGFEPSRTGYSIYDGQRVVADIVNEGSRILVHFDLAHTCDCRDGATKCGERGVEIFQKIIDQYLEIMKMTEDERWQREDQIDRVDMAVAAEEYVNMCGRRFEDRKRGVENELKNAESKVQTYSQELTDAYRRRNDAMQQLQHLAEDPGRERYRQEFLAIGQHPLIVRYRSRAGNLEVFTKQITAINEATGKKHLMGSFKITIDSVRSRVRCENLTHKRSGVNHPHVNSDGSVCFGNTSAAVSEYLAAYEYKIVLDILIGLLCSYNADSPYLGIENWPVVEETTAEENQQ